jgi:hypothetical protein
MTSVSNAAIADLDYILPRRPVIRPTSFQHTLRFARTTQFPRDEQFDHVERRIQLDQTDDKLVFPQRSIIRGLLIIGKVWPTNDSAIQLSVVTHYRSVHRRKSTSRSMPSSLVTVALGPVPSRCSTAATTKPLDASSPQRCVYIRREHPTP